MAALGLGDGARGRCLRGARARSARARSPCEPPAAPCRAVRRPARRRGQACRPRPDSGRRCPRCPGGRPSALATRRRPSWRTTTHCVTPSISRRIACGVGRRRERPVGDRAQLQEERAAQREEPLRGLRSPALAHRLEAVEEDEVVEPRRARLPDRLDQGARLREVAPRPRVDDLEARIPRPRAPRATRVSVTHAAKSYRARLLTRAAKNGSSDAASSASQTTLSPQKRPPRAASSSASPVVAVGERGTPASRSDADTGGDHLSEALLTEVGDIMPDCL